MWRHISQIWTHQLSHAQRLRLRLLSQPQTERRGQGSHPLSIAFGSAISGEFIHNAELSHPDGDVIVDRRRMELEEENQRLIQRGLSAQRKWLMDSTQLPEPGDELPAGWRPAPILTTAITNPEILADELPREPLQSELQDSMRASAQLGVDIAVETLESFGFGASWDLANREALQLAESYGFTLIRDINSTTARLIGSSIGSWIQSGAPLPDLISQLHGDLDHIFGSVRAEMIAITEATRLYAEGNLAIYRQIPGVQGAIWKTARDEWVCEICRPMRDRPGTLDGRFEAPDGTTRRIPAHPRCRCTPAPSVPREALPPVKPKPEKKKPAPKKTPAKKKKTAQPEEPTAPRPKLTAAEARAEIKAVKKRRDAEGQELISKVEEMDQKHADAVEKYAALSKRKWANRDAWTDEDQRLMDEAQEGMRLASVDVADARKARRDHDRETVTVMRGVVAAPNPSKIIMTPAGRPQKKTRAVWEEGVADFSQLVDDSVITAGSSAKPVFKSTGQQRSFFDPADSTVNMYAKAPARTVVHELGHWLEEVNPDIHAKAVSFLERRTQGESDKWLGSGYAKHETARRDKFLSHYMGKIYKNRNGDYYATEIVSMGLEYMHSDPYTLAKDDPDYFDFIYGLARGE